MKNLIKHRLFLPIVILLITWIGCALQGYWVHRNKVLHERIQDSLRKANEAIQRLEDEDRQVKQDTETLKGLLKLLPPKPTPDFKSKL